ncbi:multidrug and toxin extrusion protein 1-like [Saccoglossus kowalevskii]
MVTGQSDSVFGGRLFNELGELLKHTCLMFIVQFAVITLPAVVIIICGHIGEEELDGSTLGFALFCPLGLAIGYGLSSASSTLLSQTFGSGNYIQVGIVLQRSIYVLLLSVFPSCAILYNAEIILLFCKQDPTIASGAIWSQVVTYWFLAGVLVIYIKEASIQEQTWGGWTVEGLYDWNEIVHLGIPSIIFTTMEWSCFDIPSLVAGLLGDDELAVYSVIWQVLDISIVVS